MTSSSVAPEQLIRQEQLDPNRFLLTLMQAALHTGLVKQSTVNQVQLQIITILNEVVLEYTRGESSSVRTETAENILLSILYSLDAYLISLDSPEAALALLCTSSVREIYADGAKLVASGLEQAKALYAEVRRSKLGIPQLAYNDTIDQALPDFLRDYDMVFAAHETVAFMDYPLAVDNLERTGIFYITAYLKRLQIENLICNRFPLPELMRALADYGHVYSLDYREALINIFEVTVGNAIFSVIAGGGFASPLVDERQFRVIEQTLGDAAPAAVAGLVNGTTASIIQQLSVDDESAQCYLKQYAGQVFLRRLVSARQQGGLDKLVIVHRSRSHPSEPIALAATGMSDQLLRRLVDQIRACGTVAAKASLITQQVHSLEDYVDILQADCLYKDEYQALFATLGPLELAILAKQAFPVELQGAQLSVALPNISSLSLPDDWQKAYLSFLESLSDEIIRLVERHLDSLNEQVAGNGAALQNEQ